MASKSLWLMIVLIFIKVIIQVCSSSSSELIQIRGGEGICFNDSAIFRCTNFGETYLNWEIVPPNLGQSSFPSFNSYWHPVNFTRTDQAGSSAVLYRVTSSNTSFISATVTIFSPAGINGSRVTCNGRIMWLRVTLIDSRFTPTHLRLTRGETNGQYFHLSWSPTHSRSLLHTVVITPFLLDNEFKTRNGSMVVELENGTLYNVSIMLSACPKRVHQTFMLFGGCSLIADNEVMSVIHYDVNNSDASTVMVRCRHDNDNHHLLECGDNGEWNKDALMLCPTPTTIPLIEVSETSMQPLEVFSEDQIGELITNNQIRESFTITDVGEQHLVLSLHKFISTLAGSILAACIIAFIFGVAIGVLCGIKCSNKRRINLLDHRYHHSLHVMSVESPIYEEVGTKLAPAAANEIKMPSVDVAQNIAYECATKT